MAKMSDYRRCDNLRNTAINLALEHGQIEIAKQLNYNFIDLMVELKIEEKKTKADIETRKVCKED